MIPLADIPGRFLGDPQAGLKAILEHMPPGSEIKLADSTSSSRSWVLRITDPGAMSIWAIQVEYVEPSDKGLSMGAWDAAKARSISAWLTDVCNAVQAYVYPGTTAPIPDPLAPKPQTLREILQGAKSAPVIDDPDQLSLAKLHTVISKYLPRTKAPAVPKTLSREDALVAKMKARKGIPEPVTTFSHFDGRYDCSCGYDCAGGS